MKKDLIKKDLIEMDLIEMDLIKPVLIEQEKLIDLNKTKKVIEIDPWTIYYADEER